MSVLSAQSIRRLGLIQPIEKRTQHESGASFGLSACGYDIRLDQDIVIRPGCFRLASSIEKFHMPTNVVGKVHDKSTWARRGLAVQNTVIEPGWTGFLTLEISCNLLTQEAFYAIWYDSGFMVNLVNPYSVLKRGTPIAQVLFEYLDEATDQPYPKTAKYQNQERGPVAAKNGIGRG